VFSFVPQRYLTSDQNLRNLCNLRILPPLAASGFDLLAGHVFLYDVGKSLRVATPFGLASEATLQGPYLRSSVVRVFIRAYSCAFAIQFVSIRGYFGGLAPDAFISL
jgi:hypothetical protein